MARRPREAVKMERQLRQFETAFAALPRIVGVEAKNHFTQSFAMQRFNEPGSSAWKRRKHDRDPGRAVLVKSGSLRRSIHVQSTTATSVTIGSDLPYAQIHNDGLRMRHGGLMPKRQFIGESASLNKKVIARMVQLVKRIFGG